MTFEVNLNKLNKGLEGYEDSKARDLMVRLIASLQGDGETEKCYDSMKWFFYTVCDNYFSNDVTDTVVRYTKQLHQDWSLESLEKLFGKYWAAIAFKEKYFDHLRDTSDIQSLAESHQSRNMPDGFFDRGEEAFNKAVSIFVKDHLEHPVKKFIDGEHQSVIDNSTNQMSIEFDPAPGFRKYVASALEEIARGLVYECETMRLKI